MKVMGYSDIDSDFSPQIRDRVIDYVKQKYGEKAVCSIMTCGVQAAKGSIRSCARLIGQKAGAKSALYDIGDELCGYLPEGEPYLSSEKTFNEMMDKASAIKSSVKGIEGDAAQYAQKILEDAKLVEGTKTTLGVHAAGVIIADNGDIGEYIPLMKSKEGLWVSQCDMNYTEAKGLLKMDFLGLRNLSIITETLRSIEANTGKKIEIDKISLDDKAVFAQIFSAGKTDSVFQFESTGMKDMLRQFKPDTIEDVILLVAAYRPGPLQFLPEIIETKTKGKEAVYVVPEMEEVLGVTYSKPIYQEQLMQIFNKFAGFSLGEADIIRRLMSKKKVKEFVKYKDKFIDGLVSFGAERTKAEEFWEQIVKFSEYGFNKSHACAYAITAYYTAWLKYYYPKEYFSAVLNDTEFEKVGTIITDARSFGLRVLPPDINKSAVGFASIASSFDFLLSNPPHQEAKGGTKEGEIRYGLSNIKGVAGASESIVEERKKGAFTSFDNFLDRVESCNSGVICSLIKAGCFDTLFKGRELEQAREECFNRLIDRGIIKSNPVKDGEDGLGYLSAEKEVLSSYISLSPLGGARGKNVLSELSSDGKYNVACFISKAETKKSKKGLEYMSVTIEDDTATISVPCFKNREGDYPFYFAPNMVVSLDVSVSKGNIRIDAVKGYKQKIKAITYYLSEKESLKDANIAVSRYLSKNGAKLYYVFPDGAPISGGVFVDDKILEEPALSGKLIPTKEIKL